MYVVIFRARIKQLDAEYEKTGERMYQLAFEEFGCLDFHNVSSATEEVTLSYWPDRESIAAWKAHPEHVAAQALGRERWYHAYTIEIAEVARQYQFETLPLQPAGQ
jgi:heme-degrading monooxygenase HmoA